MPYALSLQQYTKPEFYAVAPESWESRLREISPVLPHLAHLRFRKFAPREDWYYPDRPIWALYACTPIKMISDERAEDFRLHWSELPKERQMGRKSIVSDYQHFMWHTQGVSARLFWLLQGDFGGTPAIYTEREKAYLRGSGLPDEAFPIGFFRGCPFDERAVQKIAQRDRLIQAGNRLDALEAMDRPDAKKAEDDAAELLYRETYIDTLKVMVEPNVEFMKSTIAKTTVLPDLPPPPPDLDTTLATWKDTFKMTGKIPGVKRASQRLSNSVLQTA